MSATSQVEPNDVFLSYHWRDREQVEMVARRLRDHSVEPFLDRWYLMAGKPWPRALERKLATCRAAAVFVGPGEMGPWQQREMYAALDRQGREQGFPVIPILLPGCDPALGFLSQNTWIDLRDGVDDPGEIVALARAIRREPRGPDLASRRVLTVCPYRGLLYFREEDHAFFFGRDADSDRVAEAVRSQTLTFIVGGSGSGKSSLVRAGVIPRLRRDREAWDMLTMIPKERPLVELARVLVGRLEPEMTENSRMDEAEKIAASLAQSPSRLRDLGDRILEKQPGTERLLLVVDQWEELYTVSAWDQREKFLAQVLDATSGGGRLHVAGTLRGDFVGKALEDRALADRMQGAQQLLGPMTREELGSVIEGPAKRCGLRFDQGLAGRILDDAVGQPGHLPLLEFVLEQLWIDTERPRTHAAYDAMNGLKGALAKHAEGVMAKLSEAERAAARRIFLQLVRPADGGATRRRAEIGQMGSAEAEVARRLAGYKERLLVVSGGAGEPETAEVSHEALIESWDYLKQLVRDERVFLDWRERFRMRFEEWLGDLNDGSRLLGGSALAEAERWMAERTEHLSGEERRYVAESRRAADEAAAREKRRAEDELATRKQAEQLIQFMTFDLRDKLKPLGRLDLMGDVNRAVEAYYRVAGSDRGADHERSRAVLLNNQGNVFAGEGNPAAALQAFREARRITEELLKQDTGNTLWRRDLSIYLRKIGDVELRQGNRAAGLQAYKETQRIAEELVKQDPCTAEWKQYLSDSLKKIGDIYEQQGDVAGAVEEYMRSLSVAEELARLDPSNVQWQKGVERIRARIASLRARGTK